MKQLSVRRSAHILAWLALLLFILPYIALAQSKFPVRNWMGLDSSAKLNIMRVFIERAAEDKVILRLPAEYYVKELDLLIENAFRKNDLEGLNNPLGVVIHTIAAMEGDWDNGENKLEHAKKWMGQEYFETFKQLYPDKYRKLLETQ